MRARLRSLDILRGITIALMILVNTSSSYDGTYAALQHALWDGWTLADTIFPFFLWIMGFSVTLAIGSRVNRGDTRASIARHGVVRAVVLYASGVAVDAFPAFSWNQINLAGVLQKIALCYCIAFVVFLCSGWTGTGVAVVALNSIYLGLVHFYPVPGCGAGSWTVDCNVARHMDQMMLNGRAWWSSTRAGNPDGFVSVLPAASTAMFGVLAACVFRGQHEGPRRIAWLTAAAVLLVAGGLLFALVIPINKTMWTTSYSLLMSGMATVSFACLHLVVDAAGTTSIWWKPFEILGLNALTAYVFSRIATTLAKVHVLGYSVYEGVILRISQPPESCLMYACGHLMAAFVLALFLYRQRWIVKL